MAYKNRIMVVRAYGVRNFTNFRKVAMEGSQRGDNKTIVTATGMTIYVVSRVMNQVLPMRNGEESTS